MTTTMDILELLEEIKVEWYSSSTTSLLPTVGIVHTTPIMDFFGVTIEIEIRLSPNFIVYQY